MRGKLSLRKPNFWRRTQSSLSAPNLVTSFSRDKGKVLAALANIPGARIDFNVDAQVQAILETVLGNLLKIGAHGRNGDGIIDWDWKGWLIDQFLSDMKR